jgi:hypothetical protein
MPLSLRFKDWLDSPVTKGGYWKITSDLIPSNLSASEQQEYVVAIQMKLRECSKLTTNVDGERQLTLPNLFFEHTSAEATGLLTRAIGSFLEKHNRKIFVEMLHIDSLDEHAVGNLWPLTMRLDRIAAFQLNNITLRPSNIDHNLPSGRTVSNLELFWTHVDTLTIEGKVLGLEHLSSIAANEVLIWTSPWLLKAQEDWLTQTDEQTFENFCDSIPQLCSQNPTSRVYLPQELMLSSWFIGANMPPDERVVVHSPAPTAEKCQKTQSQSDSSNASQVSDESRASRFFEGQDKQRLGEEAELPHKPRRP